MDFSPPLLENASLFEKIEHLFLRDTDVARCRRQNDVLEVM